MNENIYLWRIVIKPDSKEGQDPFEFCKSNNFLGCGYGLIDKNGNVDSSIPKDINEYKKLAESNYKGRGFTVTINAFKEMKINDLIWTRNNGVYYLCRVNGKWRYENSIDNISNDIFNVIPVEFIKIGTVENVPGKVVNSFRVSSAVQGIQKNYKNNPSLEASKAIYNHKTGTKYYKIYSVNKNDILDMFLPEDVEEIISLYLQYEKNYLIYSSTNKIDTAKYEFVAVSRDGNHLCYPQVKTGYVPLDFNEYDYLAQNGNKVYLFAASQSYVRNNNPNIIALTKDEILDFVYKDIAIMPERIKVWVKENVIRLEGRYYI